MLTVPVKVDTVVGAEAFGAPGLDVSGDLKWRDMPAVTQAQRVRLPCRLQVGSR